MKCQCHARMSGPITLKQLCTEEISNHILSASTTRDIFTANKHAKCMPLDLSQDIFDFCVGEAGTDDVNHIFNFFRKHSNILHLRSICLQNVRIADVNIILCLVEANLETLKELDLRGCDVLPKKFWSLLQNASNLNTLKTSNLLIPFQCPKLEVLVVDWKPKQLVQRLQRSFQSSYYDKLLENIWVNLTYLDLSWCHWTKRLQTLGNAKALKALILRGCDVSDLIDDISKLTGLRVLDISVGLEQDFVKNFNGKYSNPDVNLHKIVSSLTKLEYLDISGTNMIPTSKDIRDSFISALEIRKNVPFQFLGMYSSALNEPIQVEYLPAEYVASYENSKAITEAIKRNVDMPKTLENQIFKLTKMLQSSLDANMLLEIQIKMLKNLRANKHFRLWALECLYNFLNSLEQPANQINWETRMKLFSVLNRLNRSHSEREKDYELSLLFTFKIFLKLLSVDETKDAAMFREYIRLGKFLVSLKRTNFVYFKTETLLFRLLCRLSFEPNVCTYLSENAVVPNCFELFKTIQVYLGFSLRVHQTSEIVAIIWKSVLSYMQASQNSVYDFIKFKGLSWMYAHLSWFSYDQGTLKDLRSTFKTILIILETKLKNSCSTMQIFSRSSRDLMDKVKIMIDQS